MKENKTILAGFFLISVLNLMAVIFEWQNGIYLTKPLLMTFLAIWLYLNTKNNFTPFAKYIFFGILFSIAGDTFLMFVGKNPNFFLFGLGSFLITHLLYITALIKYPNFKNGIITKKAWPLIPVVLYLLSFTHYLWPDIPDNFKAPVLIYSCIISIMLLSCINMKWRVVAANVSTYLILGSVLFVFSDSVIALNKFKTLPLSTVTINFIIMATYIAGQYIIANSCIIINKEI